MVARLAQIDVGEELQSIGSLEAMQNALDGYNPEGRVRLQPVTPWGAFTAALNAAVTMAIEEGYDLILFQVKVCEERKLMIDCANSHRCPVDTVLGDGRVS